MGETHTADVIAGAGFIADADEDPNINITTKKTSSGEYGGGIPHITSRVGRPILLSTDPCWTKDFDDANATTTATIVAVLLILVLAMLAEGIRYLRESFESSYHLVIARNRIDVNTRDVQPVEECDPNDEECLYVVDEVVVPMKVKLCSWRHLLNSLLYGWQCALQLECLIGVLSLNTPVMIAAVFGVLLGRLCFFWRPRLNLQAHTSLR